MLALILGGASSGKSEYAEALAVKLAEEKGLKKLYLATMHNDGEEARQRVLRHRALRQGKGFYTVEAPMLSDLKNPALFQAAAEAMGTAAEKCVILLETLSVLAANELFSECGIFRNREMARTLPGDMLRVISALPCAYLIVVSDEIFSDGGRTPEGEPYDPATCAYLQVLGEAHRLLADQAELVTEVCMGIPRPWKNTSGASPCSAIVTQSARGKETPAAHMEKTNGMDDRQDQCNLGRLRSLPKAEYAQYAGMKNRISIRFFILLTGGAFQGQEEYAAAHYPGSKVFPELSAWFRELLREGKEPEETIKRALLPSENVTPVEIEGGDAGSSSAESMSAEGEGDASPAVVIAHEIGSGVVPLNPFERILRERYGRFMTELAERAERVERIFCGLSERLK